MKRIRKNKAWNPKPRQNVVLGRYHLRNYHLQAQGGTSKFSNGSPQACTGDGSGFLRFRVV